jgi:sugar lactone lactonase YvrE
VPIPARHVSACVFGGEDLKDLYVTTARKRLSAAELAAQPHSGGVFRVRTDVQGRPTCQFDG